MDTSDDKKDKDKAITIFFNLACQYESSNQRDMAAMFWWNTLEIDISHAASWNELGTYMLREQKYKNALTCYKRATVNDFKNSSFRYDFSNHLFYMERYEEAVESYKILLAMNPDDPAILYDYGMSLARVKNFESAVVCLTEVKNIAEKQEKDVIVEKAEKNLKIYEAYGWKSQKPVKIGPPLIVGNP